MGREGGGAKWAPATSRAAYIVVRHCGYDAALFPRCTPRSSAKRPRVGCGLFIRVACRERGHGYGTDVDTSGRGGVVPPPVARVVLPSPCGIACSYLDGDWVRKLVGLARERVSILR